MKNFLTITILIITIIFIPCMVSSAQNTDDNSLVGAWYSTWYAKVPEIKSTWINNFGVNSTNQFIGDVNNDNKDDAIVFNHGDWYVALSNGNGFCDPTLWLSGHGIGSNNQFLADVNADGSADAIVYFPNDVNGDLKDGDWYVALSNGVNKFNNYSLWKSGYGSNSENQLFADCNGDGKCDAITVSVAEGDWYVALSNGIDFGEANLWISAYGINSNKQFFGDINNDGTEDAVVYYSNGDWYVALSTGNEFIDPYKWTQGHGVGSAGQLVTDANGDGYSEPFVFFGTDVNGDSKVGDWYGRKNNKIGGVSDDEVFNSGFGASSNKQFQGNVTGDAKDWKASIAYYSSTGTWEVQRYKYYKYNIYNTWEAWDIKYLPYTLGSYQTYDSGDTQVIDEHLSMCEDAMIDFLLLDETNNLYVDEGYIFDRAKEVSSRVAIWNNSSSHRSLKYSIAIGGIQYNGDPATLEWEAGEVWNEFVNTDRGGTDNYLFIYGKPLLVVYCPKQYEEYWQNWNGDKTNTNKFTVRWARSPSEAGTYGWEIRNGTLNNDEVMVVMPGWNNNKGETPVSRDNGDFYALSCWNKVLEKEPKPDIVVINSFNEYAEETAIAPADTSNLVYPSEKWYNKNGQIDDFMYWDMTKKYINILHQKCYKASNDFSNAQGWYRWYYLQQSGNIYKDMLWDISSSMWRGDYNYCLIMPDKQHPDINDSVRKWVAPHSGMVAICGILEKETFAGDGIFATIKINDTIVWGPNFITDTTAMSHNIMFNINAGDAVYFIVNQGLTNLYDTVIWDPVITYQ